MSVTTLRPTLNADERAYAAMRTLKSTLQELDAIAAEDPHAVSVYATDLDRHDTEIALLLARLRMKQSTIHLCNHFGRPAPRSTRNLSARSSAPSLSRFTRVADSMSLRTADTQTFCAGKNCSALSRS